MSKLETQYPLDHRPLLQYIIAVRTVSQSSLSKLYLKHIELVYGENALAQFDEILEYDLYAIIENQINTINMKLLPLNYEIRKHKDRTDAVRNKCIYYSYINMLEDEPSKVATPYNAESINVITNIIKKCVENSEKQEGQYCISSVHALNEYKSVTGKSMAAGKVLFDNLIKNGWLSQSEDGKYILGLRLAAELNNQIFL